MSTQTLPIDYAARALALLISSQYINSIVNTQRGAQSFLGRPVSPTETVFFPPLGGRNGAIGLSILLLSLNGDRWAAGVVYSCCTFIGFSDLWTCWKFGGDWRIHAAGTLVLGGMGWGLLSAA